MVFCILGNITAELAACSGGSAGKPAYPIGGSIGGLSTSALVVANGAATVAVASNASSFEFATPVFRGAAGVQGTRGIASAGNVPGARDGAVSWADSAGNLWLFGGESNANPLAGGELNDRWKYAH